MVADTHPLDSPGRRLAVVIPTLNDDAALARLLPILAHLELPPEHVIVVDGASSEATAALCSRAGCSHLPCRPGRGLQLRAGIDAARAAGAEILWMVHADCEPHPLAARAVRETIAAGASGGYFNFRFGGERSAFKRVLEICIAWRCRLSMVYGDQGIFVSRRAYDATPGMGSAPLFEEVPLVRALRRTRRFVAVPLPMVVSERRWRREGLLLRTARNRALALAFAAGVDAGTLERWYRASRARQSRS